LIFGRLGADEQGIAAHFQIRSIPTLMIFREQIVLYSEAGMLPASGFEQVIQQVKELDMAKVKADIETAQAEQKS